MFQWEPGCLAYSLLADIEQPTSFVTYESWESEAALEAHMKAPTLTNALPVLKDILVEPIEQIRLNPAWKHRITRITVTECPKESGHSSVVSDTAFVKLSL